jgi:hypothetical protein
MSDIDSDQWENAIEYSIPTSEELEQVAKVLCERALSDAKSQLHPLLQNLELDRLDQRLEFLRAFKCALEHKIAQTMAAWYPSIQAIFSYDATPYEIIRDWDGSIHLLVKVPFLTEEVKELGKKLEGSLVKCLKQLSWQRFQECQSILDIQQVTPNELSHGIGYGAMFYAVYTAPVKLWPLDS